MLGTLIDENHYSKQITDFVIRLEFIEKVTEWPSGNGLIELAICPTRQFKGDILGHHSRLLSRGRDFYELKNWVLNPTTHINYETKYISKLYHSILREENKKILNQCFKQTKSLNEFTSNSIVQEEACFNLKSCMEKFYQTKDLFYLDIALVGKSRHLKLIKNPCVSNYHYFLNSLGSHK